MRIISGEKDLTRYRYCAKCGEKVAEVKGHGFNAHFTFYSNCHKPIGNQYLCKDCYTDK